MCTGVVGNLPQFTNGFSLKQIACGARTYSVVIEPAVRAMVPLATHPAISTITRNKRSRVHHDISCKYMGRQWEILPRWLFRCLHVHFLVDNAVSS